MVFTGTARQNFTWGSCAKTGVEYHVFYRSSPASPVTPHTGRAISPQTDTLPGLALQLSRARPAPTEPRGHRGHTPAPQTATSPPNHVVLNGAGKGAAMTASGVGRKDERWAERSSAG